MKCRHGKHLPRQHQNVAPDLLVLSAEVDLRVPVRRRKKHETPEQIPGRGVRVEVVRLQVLRADPAQLPGDVHRDEMNLSGMTSGRMCSERVFPFRSPDHIRDSADHQSLLAAAVPVNIADRQELTHNPAVREKKAVQLLQVCRDPIEASLLCVAVVADRCGGVELTRRVKILFSAIGGDQHLEF